MTILLNGEARDLEPGATVRALSTRSTCRRRARRRRRGRRRGRAARQWETTELDEGARVEVLRAIQGG